MKKPLLLAALAGMTLFPACQYLDEYFEGKNPPPSKVTLKTHSVTPSLIKALPGYENLKMYPLISSDDKLPGSPNFLYGAQPDGAGILPDPKGKGYIMVTNHEIHQAVSRVYLDETFKPVKGEYIVDTEGGQWRLCSATLATPKEHGFGPVYLTAGESGPESMVHAIDPLGSVDLKNKTRVKPALGRASMENAVPLPQTAYPGKTVIIIGEDDGNGQLVAYISDAVGDLDNGKLYVLKRTNDETVETDMTFAGHYDVEFVEIENAKMLTGAQIAAKTVEKKAIQFARVEDVDYRKDGIGREVYFTATGVSEADKVTPVWTKTMWGRVYRLTMDEKNPLKGMLEIIADGSGDAGNNIVNPDNLCVTKNYVYIQEDGDSFYKENKHDGIIWQYNIGTTALRPMIIMDHRRDVPEFNAKYNTVNSNLLSSWEYGAMLDISELVGVPNTFTINIHPHTWQEDKFANPDGSGISRNREGGQTVVVTGIPR